MSFLPPYRYISGEDLAKLVKSSAKPKEDYIVVDVRDEDYRGGHVVGGVHVPSNTFLDNVQELLEDTKSVSKVIFHCSLSQRRGPKAARIYSELRSEMWEREDRQDHYQVYVLRGGFKEFQTIYKDDTKLVEGWSKAVWNNPYLC